MTSTNTNGQDIAGTAQKNVDNNTAKADLPVNLSQTDSNKPVVASNQDNINFNANVVSKDSTTTNQTISEQPKAQSVNLPATTTNQNSDMSYVPITTTAVGPADRKRDNDP